MDLGEGKSDIESDGGRRLCVCGGPQIFIETKLNRAPKCWARIINDGNVDPVPGNDFSLIHIATKKSGHKRTTPHAAPRRGTTRADPGPVSSSHLNSLTARIWRAQWMARRGRSEQCNGEEILREETGRARSGEEDGSRFTFAASRMEEKKRDTDIERRPTVEKPRQQTPLLSPFIFCRRSILHPLPQPTAQSRSGKKGRKNNT